ncbi:MAG: NAD(P)/FAD-dependent oxidoreductase [Gomphosphaeria aponina SAG 52.96 = DSM 107014]|uniref:NAD(P)/FAD-dependent oxidoreductase n=1 Tax=Gomphosphaeria aponina SAG 52.96 = DSM 107014 TaxID=1521640 RepID=A0A941GMB1_9CHRO|nr:NAD(P)/FAD-dependent oxidoreductase [Gomphosphaeria aponina SAG 52.96 = DSM 107014]
MKNFDVVIVGAGPAGGHGARLLAKLGYQVLLVEQHENFSQNIFSSAATPRETLTRFDLPVEVVASFWQKVRVITTNVNRSWESEQSLGAVFDFAKLRAFLAEEVEINGGEVWLGCRYVQHQQKQGKTLVLLKKRGGETIIVATKILVDATGYARKVIYEHKQAKPDFLKGTGIEYLIEVETEKYQKYADSLTFFLGYKWMPAGYSWIFPMGNNRLKVGAAIINEEHKIVKEIKPLKYYINLVLKEYIKQYKIIDVHGSILQYSMGLKDIYYRDNIVAIGDAVSTVNFLGGEGIRHGMEGAEIAVKYLAGYLKNQLADFSEYQKEMQQRFALKWNLSEQISRRVYLEYSDGKIDKGVAYLTHLTTEEMMEVLFNYKFDQVPRGIGKYLLQKIRSWLQGVWRCVF